jgi:hypothetical protein
MSLTVTTLETYTKQSGSDTYTLTLEQVEGHSVKSWRVQVNEVTDRTFFRLPSDLREWFNVK